jgi:hypothetical protein
MADEDKPYATIVIDESVDESVQGDGLIAVLKLTYVLSAFIYFIFPMEARVTQIIDSAFDKVFGKGAINSKGIMYAKNISECEIARLLEHTTFVLTTNTQMWRTALEIGLPYVYFSRDHQQFHYLEFNYLDRIQDEELKQSLIRCLQQYINDSQQLSRSTQLSKRAINSACASSRKSEE